MINELSKTHGWQSIAPLNKGWSRDEKYMVCGKRDEKLLLRISDASALDTKKKQFELLKAVEELNIHASKPIEIGALADGRVYMLLS